MILPFADLVLLTGTSSLAVVFGMILAIFMLGERMNPVYDIATAVLIITGCMLTIVFANRKQEVFTKASTIERLKAPGTIVFLATALTFYASTFFVFKK